MKNVIIYVRVSSVAQVEKGYSIDAQLADCRRKAKEIGAADVEEYVEKGKSGKFIDRPELQRMLYNINKENKKYDALIVYKLDRLSRETMDFAYIIKILRDHGIKIISTDGTEYGDTPQDTFTMHLMGIVAEFDNALRRERSIRGKIEKRRQGKIDKIKKYGYVYNDETQNFDINPTEADIIRKIYKWFNEEHIGAYKIAKRINLLKVPTPLPSKNIFIWHEYTVRGLLRDESYAGTMHTMKYKYEKIGIKKFKKTIRPRTEWIDVPVPAIVTRKEWEQVQETLNANKNNKRNTKHVWLIQGITYCNVCKCPMYIKQSTVSSKNVHYLRYYLKCRTKIYATAGLDTKCGARSVQVHFVEDIVWKTLMKIFYSKETLMEYLKEIREGNKQELLSEELTNKKHKILKKKKAITDWFLNGKIEEEIAIEKLNILNKELDELSLRLKEISKDVSTNHVPADVLYNKFHEATNPSREKQKEIVQSVVKKIYVQRTDNNMGKTAKPTLKVRIILY